MEKVDLEQDDFIAAILCLMKAAKAKVKLNQMQVGDVTNLNNEAVDYLADALDHMVEFVKDNL
jgi:hypothetical protein